KSWTYAILDSHGVIGRFVFPTSLIGYASGGPNIGDAIMKTTDGGASWRHLPPPIDTVGVEYWGIDFRDIDHGMVITAHADPLNKCYNLWRTSNGGGSLQLITNTIMDPCTRHLGAITHVGGTTWVIGANSIE